MSLRYLHTLIPISCEFTPSNAQVMEFLDAILRIEVIPDVPAFSLRTPSSRMREFRNPFTGKTEIRRMKDIVALADIAQVSDAIKSLEDFEIEVSGTGRPKHCALPLDFDQPYFIGVTCRVHAELRWTSDLHDESPGSDSGPYYGNLCAAPQTDGVFTDPKTLAVIKVPRAGCARFWIEFSLGKWLFPRIEDGNLEILDPQIVSAAERSFAQEFVQGCCWG